MGTSVKGEYQCRFRGRLRGEYVLGGWEGRKLPLFGVFQVKIDIDMGDRVSPFRQSPSSGMEATSTLCFVSSPGVAGPLRTIGRRC